MAEAGANSLTAPARVTTLARNIPQRLREGPFWVIQAGVLGVTLLHLLAELVAEDAAAGVPSTLHHTPVLLYLAPIAYASLRYGIEGAFLTGLWSALLTLPNIVNFHARDLEWLTEVAYVGVVIGAGVITAIPVERERRQRHHAETTSHRLALLNDIATLTLTAGLERTLREALASLVALLDVEAACVGVVDPDNPATLRVLACHPTGAEAGERLATGLQRLAPPLHTSKIDGVDGGVTGVPFESDLPDPSPAGRVSGVLAVQVTPGRSLSSGDHQLLAGVSNQLATALANDRLQALERDRVRSYARLVTSAQEEERKRISRELHDDAAQNLVAIGRGLDTLAGRMPDGRSPPAELQQLRTLTARTLAGVRRFSRDLRPPVLDDLGLVSALESLVDDLRRRSDLTVAIGVEGVPSRLPADTELILFRIGQAALHNVERHAHATTVRVALVFDADGVRLAVIDDGCGFEPPKDVAELASSGKLGLLGMQERAHLTGAQLEIVSAPAGGTRVMVSVPR